MSRPIDGLGNTPERNPEMSLRLRSFRLLSLLPLTLSAVTVAESVDGFVAGQATAANGHTLPYRLFQPQIPTSAKLPLILHFHGAGSWGDNNTAQLGQARRFTTRAFQSKYPCYVLAPQTPTGEKWVALDWRKIDHVMPAEPTWQLATAIALAEKLIRELPIDPARVYVNGQSMGGYATWDAISRRPDLFAAAVPVCGGGDPNRAGIIKAVPVWAFHGAKDTTVPPENSRRMVAALQLIGAQIKYTEYPDVAHASWTPAYDEPGLNDWLFAQRKTAP